MSSPVGSGPRSSRPRWSTATAASSPRPAPPTSSPRATDAATRPAVGSVRRVRRWIGPALFLAIVLTSGTMALRAPGPVLTEDVDGPGHVAVLSVRRAPVLLSQFVADGRLSARLDGFLADPALGGGRDRSCVVV